MSEDQDRASGAPSVDTWDVLVSLGFHEDQSDWMHSFCYSFGNFKLNALRCTNRWFVDIVLLSGVMTDGRSLADVHGELRLKEESRERVLAHVAWTLDQSAGGTFVPLTPTPWLEEGRAHQDLLPWVRERREYEEQQAIFRARPHCIVAREWMRLGIKTLRAFAETADTDQLVIVAFDGSALSFRAPALACIMAAEGQAWVESVSVRADAFAETPRRLKRFVEVGVWAGALAVGPVSYPLVR
jgi:hypothetical protein